MDVIFKANYFCLKPPSRLLLGVLSREIRSPRTSSLDWLEFGFTSRRLHHTSWYLNLNLYFSYFRFLTNSPVYTPRGLRPPWPPWWGCWPPSPTAPWPCPRPRTRTPPGWASPGCCSQPDLFPHSPPLEGQSLAHWQSHNHQVLGTRSSVLRHLFVGVWKNKVLWKGVFLPM